MRFSARWRGARSALGRWVRHLVKDVEELRAEELRAWAASVPGTVRIAEARLRCHVRIAGEVTTLGVRTDTPFPDFEAEVTDGTDEVQQPS